MLHEPIRQLLASPAFPRTVSLLLALLALFEGAQIARAFSPAALPVMASAASGPESATAKRIDLDAIRQARLFGAAGTQAAQTEPKPAASQRRSRLDIRLLGVVKAQQGTDSVAILAESGRQRAYTTGERLKGNSGAELVEITANRILLDVSGERQFIELEKTK